MNVVTRFAPSPTGFMHIGGVRTALFAWLWARKNNGTFILRIEDTDKEREVEGSIAHIQDSLDWVGIDWDYGPEKPGDFGSCIQSERLSVYKKYADTLVQKGLAYPDPYTNKEVEEFRKKADEEKRPFLFRDHRPETFDVWDGASPLRFKVPTIKRYAWEDAVRGDLDAGEEALDDFIIMKADGYPTYNFAHIVDDAEMGVTHVLRGDEFISSTPRFLSLYEALEITPPVLVTLPPILREDRTKKLGKRDGAKDILEYKKEGYLPHAMMNFLAFIGWNPGGDKELFSKEELFEAFSLDQIQVSGGAFNEEKLRWYNREYIVQLPFEEFEKQAQEFLSQKVREALAKENRLSQILNLAKERIHTFKDISVMEEEGEFSFFIEKPTYLPESLYWSKDPSRENTRVNLSKALEALEAIPEDEWSSDRVKECLWPIAEDVGKGNILWPVRFALTGKEQSPDPFIVAGILGKYETAARVTDAITLLS